MDITKLNCPTCTLAFKKSENEPHMIPVCGHTICTTCLTDILSDNKLNFICPICQRLVKLPKDNRISQFPVNRIVLDMVVELPHIEKCMSHQSFLELYCVDCSTKICNKCLFNGAHRDHNVDLIENFINNANRKRRDIQDWVTKINGQYKAIEGYIDAYHKKMLQLADGSFDKLFKIMQEKKAESIESINDYFSQMKKSIGNPSKDVNKNSAVIEFKNRVEGLATFWTDNISFSDAIRINSEDFTKILPEVKRWVQHDNLSETKEKLRKLALSFKTSLYTAFDDCCVIEEANQNLLDPTSLQPSPASSKDKNDKMDIINEKPNPFTTMMEGSGTKKKVEIPSKPIPETILKPNIEILSKPTLEVTPKPSNNITPTISDIPAHVSQFDEELFQNSPDTPYLGPKQPEVEKEQPKAININVEQLYREGKSLSEIENLVVSNENLQNFELILGEADVKKNILCEFIQNLGTCVSMESLSLNFRYSSSVTDEIIKALSGAVYMLTNLKALNIDLSGCDLVSIKSASYLMEALEELKNLETFVISFESCDRIEQEIMIKISKTLTSFKNLKSLHLNLKDCSLVGEDGLQLLSKSLKALGNNLLEFNLSLGKSNLSKEGVLALAEALGYAINLEALSLDFSGNYLVEDKESLEIVSSISSMTSLKNLTVKFDKCLNVKTLTIASLGQALLNFKELRELHIGLENCKSIDEEGFLSLGKAINKLEKLEIFGLFVMESPQINDACMNHVAEGLQACKRLRKLYFSFDGCTELTDNFLFSLSDALGMMFDLELLMLPLEGCKKITPHGLQFIFDVFSDLEKLQEINLYLGGCAWLDIDAMKKFSNALIVLKSLKIVVLDISKHISVTDEGIIALGKAFAELSNLIQLSVFMDGCKILTTEGCTKFAKCMSSLENLKRFELSLQNIPDVDEARLNTIKELFADKKGLELRVTC